MRILFITATRLGDAVLSTGLLDHLARTYPGARFTVACGPVAQGVFTRLPGLDRLIVVDKKRFDLHWLTLWAACIGTHWDLAIDLRGSALTLLLRTRRRAIMRGGRRPGHRLNHLAGALKLAPPPRPIAWWTADDEAAAIAALPDDGVLIGLGPTANWPGKIWPADRFVALFQSLAARIPGARPVIFGGPGEAERALAAPVLAALPGAVDLVGRFALPQVAASLARCALFIGNDSGLMHLAAAAGTPTLGLFGPTNATEYAPAGRLTAAITAEAPGQMADLPLASVLQAALTLHQATPTKTPTGIPSPAARERAEPSPAGAGRVRAPAAPPHP